jgi:hypothetical protein
MENYALWILIGYTLLGTLIFVAFAFAVKGLAGEIDKPELPEIKPAEKRAAESKV